VLLLVLGFVCVALGTMGIVVPGLPTTGFFILAASCFSRSSPRFERWVLELPGIGPMVADHRAGLGMPRRAKVAACSMIVLFVALSAVLALDGVTRWVVVALGVVGVLYVALRVPTREVVLAERAEAAGHATPADDA
jgi:uncharacterized membrane protein YbaN (DUF454 family)